LYKYWRKHGDFTKHTWKRFKDYIVQLGFDFSQNELREVAEQSGDRHLAEMFASGKDPHVEIGHELTGWDKELIAHDDRVRRVIKNMQFGIVFGLQGEGLYKYCLALGAETTREEVEAFHAKYFKRFPRVKWLQEHYRHFVEKHGYVCNPYGFRRNVNVEEQKRAEEAGEEREGGWWGNVAINTPVQSAAHHFLTMAFATLRRKPKKYKLLKYPQLEVHDALYNGVKLKYLLKAAKLGHELMVDEPMRISEEEFGIKKKVPLATKPKAGFRFGVHIEGIGKPGLDTEWDFLNEWCKANRKLEKSYLKQLSLIQ
jgi:DNA polymerase I-like protein with 3'-5' exonuclease and polymerase domains